MSGRVFIPITKVDAVKRMVYASIDETPDRVDEIFDYDTNKPLFEKWSKEIAKSTDGKSLGNVRAMHGNIAAGKVTGLEFADADKRVDFAIKVVDDAEWTKVIEGVYTGISPGGTYLKKWPDTADSTKKRYTADPVEVSLVDLPCIPSATFTMVKADGVIEQRAFKAAAPAATDDKPQGADSPAAATEPTNDQIAARARELAKAAGDETKWAAQIEAARADLLAKAAAAVAPGQAPPTADPAAQVPTNVDPSGEVEQVWKAKDGKTFGKKAEAVAHNASLKAAATVDPLNSALGRLGKALDGAEGKPPAEAATAPLPPQSGPASAAPAATDPPKDGQAAAAAETAPAGGAEPAKEPAAEVLPPVADKAALATALKGLQVSKASPRLRRHLIKAARALKATADLPDSLRRLVPAQDDLKKGFYMVGWLGRLLDDFHALEESLEYSAWREGLPEGIPDKLGAALGMIGDVLIEVVSLEVANMKGEEAEEAYAAAAEISDMVKAAHEDLAKGMGAGARVQKIHDHTVKAGAKCAKGSKKGVETEDFEKAVLERDALQKAVTTAVAAVEQLTARVLKLEKAPEPMPSLRVVEKGADAATIEANAAAGVLEELRKSNPEAVAMALFKVSQANPQTVFARGQAPR